MSAAAAIGFESRAVWGTSADTPLGKALAVLHLLLAPFLVAGRGLHSSPFQLNLSRFGHTSPYPPVSQTGVKFVHPTYPQKRA